MCGGSDHHGKEAHHQANQERHEHCSCGHVGGMSFMLLSLGMLSMVTHVACDKGEVTELLKSNNVFRGKVSLDLAPGKANFNLLQSLTTERIQSLEIDERVSLNQDQLIDLMYTRSSELSADQISNSNQPSLNFIFRDQMADETPAAKVSHQYDLFFISDYTDQTASDEKNHAQTKLRSERLADDANDAHPRISRHHEEKDMENASIAGLKLDHRRNLGEDHSVSGERVAHVVGASIVMLVVSAFGVSLPDLIRRFARDSSESRRGTIRTLCCAFAAGGFWGLALIHVLVEAVTGCSNIRFGLTFSSGAFMNAAFALAALGYLLMLAVQCTASISSQKTMTAGAGEETQYKAAMFDAAVASVALTFHSFFEGMVVGMRDTHLLIWIATISVVGHKWAAGFALSMRMEVHGTPKFLKWTTLTIFVLASPIGALVGMPLGVMETSGSAVVLNSLSAGILMFVASETTAEVFGGTSCGECSREDLIWKEGIQKCEDPCCINRCVSLAESKPLRKPPSFRRFAAQLLLFILGLALVFGMMTLHMRNPGHEHKD